MGRSSRESASLMAGMAAAFALPFLGGCAGTPAARPAPEAPAPPSRTATPNPGTVVHPYDPHSLSVRPVPDRAVADDPAARTRSTSDPSSAAAPLPSDPAEVSVAPAPAAHVLPETIRTVALPPKVDEPRPLAPIRIPYPELARKRGQQGTVEIELTVTETGAVTDARVAASSGSSLLDEAARRPFTVARFEPARRSGQAIPLTFRQTVRFVLSDAH
jgi:periplasmic protein TonB